MPIKHWTNCWENDEIYDLQQKIRMVYNEKQNQLYGKIRELQEENDELKKENEKLKKEYQQIWKLWHDLQIVTDVELQQEMKMFQQKK